MSEVVNGERGTARKYKLEPEQMPATLHWFKWEAYTTWLTGMVLLTIIYYLGADSYLIDKRVAYETSIRVPMVSSGGASSMNSIEMPMRLSPRPSAASMMATSTRCSAI